MAHRRDERRLAARERERRRWARAFVRDVARRSDGDPVRTFELLSVTLGPCRYYTDDGPAFEVERRGGCYSIADRAAGWEAFGELFAHGQAA